MSEARTRGKPPPATAAPPSGFDVLDSGIVTITFRSADGAAVSQVSCDRARPLLGTVRLLGLTFPKVRADGGAAHFLVGLPNRVLATDMPQTTPFVSMWQTLLAIEAFCGEVGIVPEKIATTFHGRG